MIIHQSLHGYKNGHHKLASSLSLSTESENKMLLFSDWSEYDGGIDGDMSYITCYPLGDDNHYVIAKTWYAQEAERPGSVWTHSLIIPIDNIKDDLNFATIENYFHRPDSSNYDYSLPLEIQKKENFDVEIPLISSVGLKSNVESIYYALSCSLGKMVIPITQPSKFYRKLLLTILQYMPLEMLRDIAACSGWSSHKKSDSYTFNLIFCSGVNYAFGLIKDSEIPVSNSEQLHYISDSITKGNSTISDLIRFFSDDIGADHNKLYCIISLVCALESAYIKDNGIQSYSEIVDVISCHFPLSGEGTSLKKLFFGKNTALLFCKESEYYLKLATINDKMFADWELIDFNKNASSYLFSSFENFVIICKQLSSTEERSNSKGLWLLNYASTHMPQEWIQRIFSDYWEVFIKLAKMNINILSGDFWFGLSDARLNEILDLVLAEGVNVKLDWPKLFLSIISNGYTLSIAQINALHNRVSNLVNLAMDCYDNGRIANVSSWITFVSNHPKEILTWVHGKDNISNQTADYLINNFNANSTLVKSMGSGVWKAFYRSSNDYTGLRNFIFMFALAQNWKDEFSLLMLKRSFVKIYNSLANNNIQENEWTALSPYLASLPFWQNWDNCKKLRLGVVNTLISLGYSKDVLYNFTSSKNINIMLMRIWDKKNK